MKKLLSAFFSLALLGGVICAAPVKVDLDVCLDDDSPIVPSSGKGPVYVPDVFQDGMFFTLEASHPGYYLQLLDENGDIAYSLYVPSTQTTVSLPSTLSGNYELRLSPAGSSIYFYGYVMF